MRSVCVGIQVCAAAQGLRATIASVWASASRGTELVLLPDGTGLATQQALETCSAVRQLGTEEPRGAAACFNRLVVSTNARVVVLLECGAIIGPGGLDYLLEALDADPRHGLAGPSTNRAWNEQCAFAGARGEPDAIARTARASAQRFGSAWRTLAPLHSLADFCYVVRREVFEAIGPADEGYGRGPCWEMDYNIRAARAGWRGVWVPGAYVHRLPPTEARRIEEARLFEASKHRYQDKFCGARLRGEKHDYRSHCRGDACPNFAPASFASRWRPDGAVTLSRPDPAAATPPLHEPTVPGGARLLPSHPNQDLDQARPQPRPTRFMAGEQVRKEQGTSHEPLGAGRARLPPSRPNQDLDKARQEPRPTGFMATEQVRKKREVLQAPVGSRDDSASSRPLTGVTGVVSEPPLVSCVMPTFNRRAFVPAAVACFLRQDYPNRELLILDDGTDPIGDCVPNEAQIRYLRLPEKLVLGAKRNLGCSQARGEFLAHWDDDDWYPRDRLRRQIEALQTPGIEVCGTRHLFYYDASRQLAWRYRYAADARSWVAGNTLAYRRSFWERHPFPAVQVGEDTQFVWSAQPQVVRDLDDPALCVANLHPGNTGRKQTSGSYWHPCSVDEVRQLLGEDLAGFGGAVTSPPGLQAGTGCGGPGELPLVSCIMPTANRRAFLPLALEHYQRQDYPNRELVVVDDGSEPVGDLVSGWPEVRYVRLTHRTSIGGKRNLAVQHSRGDLIAHWDDDDWYAPDRLRYQILPILENRADLTGLENAFTLELPSGQFWTVDAELHRRLFVGNVHGGTLVYRRQLFLEGLRYPEADLAEDAGLIRAAVRHGKRLLRLENPAVFVYVRHGRNAWRQYAPGRFLRPEGWRPATTPPAFSGSDLERYQAAARGEVTKNSCHPSVYAYGPAR